MVYLPGIVVLPSEMRAEISEQAWMSGKRLLAEQEFPETTELCFALRDTGLLAGTAKGSLDGRPFAKMAGPYRLATIEKFFR